MACLGVHSTPGQRFGKGQSVQTERRFVRLFQEAKGLESITRKPQPRTASKELRHSRGSPPTLQMSVCPMPKDLQHSFRFRQVTFAEPGRTGSLPTG